MKNFFVLSFVTAGFFLKAQTVGNSPYAAFGIGDMKYDNSVDVASMGGASTALISDFTYDFNFRNPAVNQNLELTTIRVEGTNENDYYKSNFSSAKPTKHSTYLSNISIAFPISKKVKFGLGFQPYASKTYKMALPKTLEDGTVEGNFFNGTGMISMVQAAVSYTVVKDLSFGLRTNFLFGKETDLQEFSYSKAELINGYSTSNKVRSFNFTLGGAYQKKLENDRKFTLGAAATFGNTGSINSQYINSTYYYLDSDTKGGESIIDESTKNVKNVIPTGFSVGAGYGKEAKWFISGQFDRMKGADFMFLGNVFPNNPAYRFSAGGWYIPNINNFRSYFSRVTYRYGAYYERGNLQINGTFVNKYALTFGARLPFDSMGASRLSSMNIGFEIGKMGTLQNNLIRQNFFNIRIGLNFADRWFNKRLYD